MRDVGEVVDDGVHHLAPALDATSDARKAGRQQRMAKVPSDMRATDPIGEAGLVLEGNEHHTPGGGGPLETIAGSATHADASGQIEGLEQKTQGTEDAGQRTRGLSGRASVTPTA